MSSVDQTDTPSQLEGMVLVMGVTGAGKSSFVNALKAESVEVGHGLESTQAPPKGIHIFLDEEKTRSVTVVDTPGFDDTRRTDARILAEITEYLAAQYALEIPLRGIIYMHPITENRMKRSSRQFLEMFRLLCGDDALRKVKLVTTHARSRPESTDDKKMTKNHADVKVLEKKKEELQKTVKELEPSQRELKARGKVAKDVKKKISEKQRKANAEKAQGMFSSAMEVFTAVLNIVLAVASFVLL